MQFEVFIDWVMDRASLYDEDQALRATEATLKTLGERITEEEAAHLAVQLPPEIGRFLTVVDNEKEFDLQTFYEQVAERESIEYLLAREHAQAVISVLQAAVDPGELHDVIRQLPDEFQTLFTFGKDWRKIEGR